jgi:diaminohydroxyphosphoribosylaminopyrimidine deaminase/5-amino-6-(5-phosphoribosylamino)uracil reductase
MRIGERHMRRVLALAARARGRTGPNPMVGAVVARGGTVVGEGYHARAGAPHAEAVALSQAGARARGATLYVNLEPCCHHGRTPPCTDAILAAGIIEVVASMRDPDPRVDGRGIRALRAARVKVLVGTLRTEAERLNEAFVKFRRTRRPFVTLKAGMSLDGRIATRGGESKWITSRAARAAARRQRGEHEAVVIGVGTVLSDDPRLTGPRTNGAGGRARREGPARVVLDTRLRTPATARMLRSAGGPVIVIAGRGASVDRRRRLERAGALVVGVPTRSGRVDIRAAIRELGRRGVATVLIEGGGEVLGAALDAGIGDRVALFVAPRLLGGRTARPAFLRCAGSSHAIGPPPLTRGSSPNNGDDDDEGRGLCGVVVAQRRKEDRLS